jgi:hypothetical protein
MSKTLQQLSDYIGTEPEIRALINETVKYLKAAWPPGGSGVQTVYSAEITLTDAQIKALPNTPVQIVADPGDGKTIFIIDVQYRFNLVAGYKLSDGTPFIDSQFGLTWGINEVNAALWSDCSTSIADVSGEFNYFLLGGSAQLPGANSGFIPGVTIVNKGIYMAAYSENDNDWIGGDPSNTMKISITLKVIEL